MKFKSVKKLKEHLVSLGYETTVVFENPDYLSAVMGITTDGRLIYDYSKMIKELESEEMTEEEAVDFIDSNTLRVLPYCGEKAPVVLLHKL